MSAKQQILNAALVGAMSPESDIAAPPRARVFSFSAAVADLEIGDAPASRVVKIDDDQSIADALAGLAGVSEKLRNNVGSAVSSAKRRNPGSDFSIEITDIKIKSGLYLLALVHRTA